MSSTRLPAKVMLQLNGVAVLEHVVERVRQSEHIDDVIIATSTESDDNAIAEFCKKKGYNYSRGSLHNVLERYYNAANENNADIVVRITSDCPLYDANILDDMFEQFDDCDYLSNALVRSFPRGLDTEIFTFKALERAYTEATEDFQKEHVTPYINKNPNIFKLKDFVNSEDNSNHRWTLDTKEDFEMIKNIYENLGSNCSTEHVLKYLKNNPDVVAINAHIEQKKV